MGAAWEHGGTWAWPVQIVENERERGAVGQASSRTWVSAVAVHGRAHNDRGTQAGKRGARLGRDGGATRVGLCGMPGIVAVSASGHCDGE